MPETTLKPSLEATDVAEYLRQNPHFLEQFPDLATALVLPRTQGSAASLAAWQLETLRDRNRELNERLAELVILARDNEQLMVRVHTLTTGLLRGNTLVDTCAGFVAALHEDFGTRLVRLVLFRETIDSSQAPWLVSMPEGAAGLPAFTEFLARGEPACGRLAQDKLDGLFGAEAASVHSTALLKVGRQGMLAIGSEDPDRFHPGIGTLFLKLIAQALDAAISRFPPPTK